MNKSVIVGIIAVAILGLGGYFILNSSEPASTSTSSSASTKPSSVSSGTEPSKTSTEAKQVAITYTDDGFSPATLTVKTDTTVIIKNNSSGELEFDSDPHPVHTDNPELNLGIVAFGENITLRPTETGTHGYHNHLNSNHTGTLIVQ